MRHAPRPKRRLRKSLSHTLGYGRGLWLLPLDVAFRIIGWRYRWLKAFYNSASPRSLDLLGRLRAERAAWNAVASVSALALHARSHDVDVRALVPWGILDRLPETDKKSYIDAYPVRKRCRNGRIPMPGTTIDESSGSTGMPYNWLRSSAERRTGHRNISFFARYCFGREPLVTVNAFSMGAWATGFNMSLALNRNGMVKSTGPDVEKIFSTLRFLGPDYRYLICGYPPFVKHLLDVGDGQEFPWARYRLHALVGGEGMAEELRDYLLLRFISVFSGYGATDIEIGMAGESPASVALRRLVRARPEIRRALFGLDSRLPMIFQYNPLIHWLEVNDKREIITTISRLDVLAPRIRYNVHDQGGIMEFKTAEEILRRNGRSLKTLHRDPDTFGPRGPLPWAAPLNLPFVWVNGRTDQTISVMGANLYPEDVEAVLYANSEVAALMHSFCMSVTSDSDGTPRPGVAIELNEGVTPPLELADRVARILLDGLSRTDADYRSAVAEFPQAMLPMVLMFPLGRGPFEEDGSRVKQRRIVEHL